MLLPVVLALTLIYLAHLAIFFIKSPYAVENSRGTSYADALKCTISPREHGYYAGHNHSDVDSLFGPIYISEIAA